MNATESCQKFEQVFSSSTKLLEKIKVSLKFPEVETCRDLTKFNSKLQNHTQLTRPYQAFEVINVRDLFLNSEDEMRRNFFEIIKKLAPSVKTLKIGNCNVTRHDLVSLMLPFTQLRMCSLTNLMIFNDLPPEEPEDYALSYPHLKKLQIIDCDFFGLLMFKSHGSLEVVELTNPHYNRADVEVFEDFILLQTRLKHLKILSFRFNSTYSTNRLASVPFQLETLCFNNVHWDISDHCETFLKSQRCLKKLELKRFQRWVTPYESNHLWFSSVMNHFFTLNPMLTSITIETKCSVLAGVKNETFLPDIVNNNVKELTYIKDRIDESEFMNIFTRIFPQIKKITVMDLSDDSRSLLTQLHLFKKLEALTLEVTPKSLDNLQLGTDLLTSFTFRATNENKSAEKLIEIFASHPTIKNVSLSIEPLTVEEITEMIVSLSPTLETISIADLHLNTFEAELFSVNFPRLRMIRSDFPLNPEILAILNNAQIKFDDVHEGLQLQRED